MSLCSPVTTLQFAEAVTCRTKGLETNADSPDFPAIGSVLMNWSDAPFTKQTLTSASHDPNFASKQQHNSTPDPRETCREEPILVPTLLKKGSQGERHETETVKGKDCNFADLCSWPSAAPAFSGPVALVPFLINSPCLSWCMCHAQSL